jgi:LVIVD repeat
MRRFVRLLLLSAVGAVALLVLPSAAGAQDLREREIFNLRALGNSPNPGNFITDPPGPKPFEANSDLAFWGNYAFNGNYDGFRIIDISDRQNPQEVSRTYCEGSQGDIVVWENILVRSYNSPAPAADPVQGLAKCDADVNRQGGQDIPAGWEGVHVFDISNPEDPVLVGRVELPCGSHTATGVPDEANNRLIIYNHTSGGPCYFFDILEVPLDAPEDARLLRQEPLEGEHACHDSGVILGDVNKMACASGHMTNVFDIGENDTPGGTLTNPEPLFTVEEEGVGPIDPPPPGVEHSGSWHSATFTWDGEVLILGWEPGGGLEPECEATDPPVQKSAFFYDADTGEKLGQWTLPRSQSAEENCTIHNYNVVPIEGRYILTSGNYQAGTWVTDFTNPAEPFVRGFADPVPLVPTQDGGAWSTYWYNRTMYESDITEGVNLWRLRDPQIRRNSMRLDHLNPQTQEFSLP